MSELRPVPYDHYPRHEELGELLRAWQAARPDLLRVSELGRSHEGREIWLAAVTNAATGPDLDKPALWVEANIHATELSGGTAALHLVHHLLTRHGQDGRVTRALDTRTFYVVPRLSPDGAELALGDPPRFVRSSARRWPLLDASDGLYEEDVDGDGRILTMRVPDPHGTWKPSSEDPRLLVARAPDEPPGGTFYRLLPEGRIRDHDGWMVRVERPLEGLDLNRNFPIEWETESEQAGAGPYPTSEPEIRAAVQGLVDRPNVTGVIAYHTFSGVHLRPYASAADERFPTEDLRTYQRIGEHATAITGYPAVSVYHDFRYDPKTTTHGSLHDWAYEHLGVYAWTTELWSALREAGLQDFGYIDWFHDHPVADDLTLVRWSDGELGGRGYVDWYPFDHPELGPVELGGWDEMAVFRNPPWHRLEAEVAPQTELALWHVLVSPELALLSLTAEPLGDDHHRIRLVVANAGWLPTNVTAKAVERQAVRALAATLELPAGASLVIGDRRTELGQLTGRALRRSTLGWAIDDSTTDRALAEWVVRAPAGTVVQVEARHDRAGVVRRELALGAP